MCADTPRFSSGSETEIPRQPFVLGGKANRIDLIEKFQISPAQAALDLRRYLESADARSVTTTLRKTLRGEAPIQARFLTACT